MAWGRRVRQLILWQDRISQEGALKDFSQPPHHSPHTTPRRDTLLGTQGMHQSMNPPAPSTFLTPHQRLTA